MSPRVRRMGPKSKGWRSPKVRGARVKGEEPEGKEEGIVYERGRFTWQIANLPT